MDLKEKKELINTLINKNIIPDILSMKINYDEIINILIDKNILIIDDIYSPSLSDISISIETIYEIFASLFGTMIIKDIILKGLLKNVVNDNVNLKDELLMYTGYCSICDSNSEFFNLNVNDYENYSEYIEDLISFTKPNNSNKFLDLFCNKCMRPLYVENIADIL